MATNLKKCFQVESLQVIVLTTFAVIKDKQTEVLDMCLEQFQTHL